MFTIASRIIQYGFKDFWRNGWLSTATVIIMVMALLVSIGLIMFNTITHHAIRLIQDKIDIAVYFKTEVGEDDILNLKKSLESLSEVKLVEYISRDKALEIFKRTHEDKPEITQSLNELNENPLEASLNIKADRPEQYASIAQYLTSPNLSALIDEVSYKENKPAIDRLTSFTNAVNRSGFILTIIMALIAGLVIFNTIRLAIYSNRDEIGIMRVVGASNALVRGPYMVQGVMAGFIAAVASVLIALPVIYFVSPRMKAFIELDVFQYFTSNLLILLGYQILFGIFIGTFSSFIAVRRYLRN